MIEGLNYYGNPINKALQIEIMNYDRLMDQLGQAVSNYSKNKDIHYSKDGFYIYKFLDKENNVLYVGRTVNLLGRFKDHHALTTDVVKIQYIKCNTYADSLWKEIYYINLYKNNKMLNEGDISHIDSVTEQDFRDEWINFDMLNIGSCRFSFRSNPILEYKHILVKLNNCISHTYFIEKNLYYGIDIPYYNKRYKDIESTIDNNRHKITELYKQLNEIYNKLYSEGYEIKKIPTLFDMYIKLMTQKRADIPVLQKKLQEKEEKYFKKYPKETSELSLKQSQSNIDNIRLQIEEYTQYVEFMENYLRQFGLELDVDVLNNSN